MVEIDAQALVADALDRLRETSIQTFVRDPLVIERWKHQDAGTAKLHGVRRETSRFGQRAASGPREETPGVDSCVNQPLEQIDTLVFGKRVRLGIGPEDGKADVVGEKPLAVADEPLRVGDVACFERGQNRGKNPLDAIGHVFDVS